MAKPISYSKWDHIEISDDEDDTHPNVDTPSLFRWRHQARVERMEQSAQEKKDFDEAYRRHQKQLNDIRRELDQAKQKGEKDEISKLELKQSDLEKQHREWIEKEEDLNKKERLTPWNIDTICHEGKSKTLINPDKPRRKVPLTPEEFATEQKEHFEKYEDDIKKFGMMQKYDFSQEFLIANDHLVTEYTANYFVLWCIDLAMEEKSKLMLHVSHQCIVMQFLLELAKTMDIDPRSCVRPFFSKLKLGEKKYMEAFNEELAAFQERIRKRAKEKLQEALEQYEEEERQKRLGPGGLDPVEVFESLPLVLQECFESKDLEKLKEIVAGMDPKEASYHIKRCTDSGMWVPGAGDRTPGDGEEGEMAEENGTEASAGYEVVSGEKVESVPTDIQEPEK